MSEFDASAVVPIPLDTLATLRHRENGVERKQLTFVRPRWQENQAIEPTRSFVNAVKHGWRRNELIYACINARSLALSMVKIGVRNPRTQDPIDGHWLTALMQRPNPYMGESDFHAARVIYQLLSGHSYWEVVRSRAGVPVQLWPLRPDWVTPVLNRNGLAGWRYQPDGIDQPINLKPWQVIDFPIFDPLNMFGGTSPTVVAGYSGDADNAVSAFVKDFFENGALPAGVLTTTQQLLESEIERIRSSWASRYGGSDQWLKAPAVLDKDATYQSIAMSFEDMGFEALDSRNEARICMVMGVPPIIVGANVGLERSTYSNYETSESAWWRNQLVPDCHHVSTRLDVLFDAELGDVELFWDFDAIPALSEDQDAIWERVGKALERGGLMVDEYRQEIGFEPLPNGAGQVIYVPMGSKVVPAAELAALPKPAASAPPGTDPHDVAADENEPESDEKRRQGALETKAADGPDDEAQRRRDERRMQAGLEEFFAEQLQRIERELTDGTR